MLRPGVEGARQPALPRGRAARGESARGAPAPAVDLHRDVEPVVADGRVEHDAVDDLVHEVVRAGVPVARADPRLEVPQHLVVVLVRHVEADAPGARRKGGGRQRGSRGGGAGRRARRARARARVLLRAVDHDGVGLGVAHAVVVVLHLAEDVQGRDVVLHAPGAGHDGGVRDGHVLVRDLVGLAQEVEDLVRLVPVLGGAAAEEVDEAHERGGPARGRKGVARARVRNVGTSNAAGSGPHGG